MNREMIETVTGDGLPLFVMVDRILAVEAGPGSNRLLLDGGRSFIISEPAEDVAAKVEAARAPVDDRIRSIHDLMTDVDQATRMAGELLDTHVRHAAHHSEAERGHYVSGAMAMFHRLREVMP